MVELPPFISLSLSTHRPFRTIGTALHPSISPKQKMNRSRGNIGIKKVQTLLFKIEYYLRKYSLWAFSIVMILLIFTISSL